LFRKDWTLKPAGVVWQTLTKKLWRTNTAGTTNRGGNFNTRAFLGNYKITVTVCGKSTVYTRELTADAVLTFPAGC
jgi:endo-1,4-beta-xylanase